MAKISLESRLKEFNKTAKLANQQMRRIERQGIDSPAYRAVQAQLEMMGIKKTSAIGRRFPEARKMTYNELQQYKSVLDKYRESKTYGIKGARKAIEEAWKTTDERYNLSENGVTKEAFGQFWKNFPEKGKRPFGSEVVMELIENYTKKNGQLGYEDNMTPAELAQAIANANDRSSAMEALGLDIEDFETAEDLGWDDL